VAIKDTEIELIPGGMNSNRPSKGGYALNMRVNDRQWQVRSGFGLLMQADSRLAAGTGDADGYGYDELVASHLIKTKWGRLQALMLFKHRGYTTDSGYKATVASQHVLVVCDLHDGARWEQPLFRHTSEFDYRSLSTIDMEPHYLGEGDSMLIAPSGSDWWFDDFADTVVFGSRSMGTWCYRPASFSLDPDPQVDTSLPSQVRPRRGEHAPVAAVTATIGATPLGAAYLPSAFFPRAQAGGQYAGRMAYASGRDVFFSEEGLPGAVRATDFITIDAPDNIVALANNGSALVIWTQTQTWMFQASAGLTFSSGTLIRASDQVGCFGPQAWARTDQGLVWADRNGVWGSDGGLAISDLSDGIDVAFDSPGLSNPWSVYQQASGHETAAEASPRSYLRVGDETAPVVATYESDSEYWFLSLREQRAALALHVPSGSWSVWTLETSAGGAGRPNRDSALEAPMLAGLDGRLFALGGIENIDYTDAPVTVSAKTWSVLEYGRGGGTDRSSVPAETSLAMVRDWFSVGSGNDYFVFGKPVRVPAGFKTPQAGAASGELFVVPVYFVPAAAPSLGIDRIELRVNIDNSAWLPVLYNGTEVDLMLPPERWPSYGGWGGGSPTAGVSEAQLYDSGSGAPSATGDQLRLYWDASAATTAHAFSFNYMNLRRDNLNPICFIPMAQQGSWGRRGMFTTVSVARTRDATSFTDAKTYLWRQAEPTPREENEREQAVDWLLASDETTPDDANQETVKARTLWVTLRNRGKGTPLTSTYYALLNAAVFSDRAGWSAQVMDHGARIVESVDKQSLRARVKDSSGNLLRRVLGSNSGLQWGSTASAAQGNYLVDDEQRDTVAISSGVKGQHFVWMLFGHIREKAEGLRVESMRGAFRRSGGRRRRGR